MNPPLPGSLIEQEKRCDLCDNWATDTQRAEIKGSDYTLCWSCYEDNLFQISDAITYSMHEIDEEDRGQDK